MNKCFFSGNVSHDAILNNTKNGTAVTKFDMAVTSGFGKNEHTTFIHCILWKREKLAQYLVKGTPVIICGEYDQSEYKDKDGNKKVSHQIIVKDFEFQHAQKQDKQQNNDNHNEDLGPAFPSEASGMDDVPF